MIIKQALEDSTVETSDDAVDKAGTFTGEGMGGIAEAETATKKWGGSWSKLNYGEAYSN